NLTFYGPDDVTIGAALVNQTIADGTLGTVHMDRVKLDATPPTIVSLFPENNANSVSPTEQLRITFSEPVSASSVTPGNFQLIATDDGSQVQVAVEQLNAPGGNAIVSPVSTTLSLDLVDPSTLIIAPIGVAISPASFYRITVSGTKDTRTPPNVQTAAQVFEYASIDNIAPVATILSP